MCHRNAFPPEPPGPFDPPIHSGDFILERNLRELPWRRLPQVDGWPSLVHWACTELGFTDPGPESFTAVAIALGRLGLKRVVSGNVASNGSTLFHIVVPEHLLMSPLDRVKAEMGLKPYDKF